MDSTTDKDLIEMYDNDLGNGPSHFIPREQMDLDEFYQSAKFMVGYRELQNKWAQAKPWVNSNGCQIDMLERRKSLTLSLNNTTKPNISCFSATSSNSSNFSSCSESPTSDYESPIIESPVESNCFGNASNSPSLCFPSALSCSVQKPDKVKQSTFNKVNDSSFHCFNIGLRKNLNTNQQNQSIFGAFKKVFRNKKSSNNLQRDIAFSTTQLYELEEQIETYRQLSESKKRAAELLKHQLMEALYERVLVELEKKHERRRLEQELMQVEWELRVLQSTTETSQRDWSLKFNSVMADRNNLIEMMKLRKYESQGHSNAILQNVLQTSLIDYRRCSI